MASDWESCKENIQPLKGGRRMQDLMNALKVADSKATYLWEPRQEFEMKLRSNCDDINVWYEYIVWTEQNFPTSNVHLHQLLERCVQYFKDSDSTRDNEKYLKIWVKLIDLLEDPSEIFNYLYSQNIGTKSALFYRTWGTYLEISGTISKADEIYQLGINRKAEPLDILNQDYTSFQSRLARSIRNSVDGAEKLVEEENVERTALGSLPVKKKGSVPIVRAGASMFPKTGIENMKPQKGNAGTAKFKIFDDTKSSKPLSVLSSRPRGDFKSVPLPQVIKKENIKELQTLKGAKVKMSAPSMIVSEPKFTIFQEEDSSYVPSATKTQYFNERAPLSTRKLAKQAPQMFWMENNTEASAEGNLVYKYCRQLTDLGTYEVSFEEMKADLNKYKVKVKSSLFDSSNKCSFKEKNEDGENDDDEDMEPIDWHGDE